MEKSANEQYEKIIPTAWLVAYRRTLSDIPYSREVFDRLSTLRQSFRFRDISDDMMAPQLAPRFEARYKLLSKLVLMNPHSQVLELAAGFSTRGMEFSQNKDITYVELDLPEVIREKEKMAGEILDGMPGNLHFAEGNALDNESMMRACSYFTMDRPISVINEGLLRYLDFDEKARLGRNIRELLRAFGGTWITPDIILKKAKSYEGNELKRANEKVRQMTGIDTLNNRFDSEGQARRFFENLGFRVEYHNYLEVREQLVSPSRLNMPQSVLKEMIDYPAYVMLTRLREK